MPMRLSSIGECWAFDKNRDARGLGRTHTPRGHTYGDGEFDHRDQQKRRRIVAGPVELLDSMRSRSPIGPAEFPNAADDAAKRKLTSPQSCPRWFKQPIRLSCESP